MKQKAARRPLVYVHPDPTTPPEAQGLRRPYLVAGEFVELHDSGPTRFTGWHKADVPCPEFEAAEQTLESQRAYDHRMPLAELCCRMARVIALAGGLVLAVDVSAAAPSPILALEASRTGRFDLQTTIVIAAHPDNLAVCVGLTGAAYPVRWGCQYVAEPTDTTVTVVWRDVPAGKYAVEAGLWRGRPQWLTTRGKKLTLTIRRAFGVHEL